MKITIKHFGSPEEKRKARGYLNKVGLQEFNSLAFQFNRIPEGTYEIDITHLFSNQYNTVDTVDAEGVKHNGFRVFEYCECLRIPGAIPAGYGYYISEGIEAIRELQARTYVCGYCGAQYLDPQDTEAFCHKCTGSEYMEPKDYRLLKLIPVLKQWKYDYKGVVVPPALVDEIQKAQLATRQRLIAKRKADKLARLEAERLALVKETAGFTWLIEHNINFENCIYYKHTDVFSFGWRTALNEEEKSALSEALTGFPYAWEFNRK